MQPAFARLIFSGTYSRTGTSLECHLFLLFLHPFKLSKYWYDPVYHLYHCLHKISILHSGICFISTAKITTTKKKPVYSPFKLYAMFLESQNTSICLSHSLMDSLVSCLSYSIETCFCVLVSTGYNLPTSSTTSQWRKKKK